MRYYLSCICIAVLLVGIIAVPAMQAGAPAEAFADYTVRLPIRIDGDAGFTAVNGVIGGNGTSENPWIIEGWDISGHGYGYCIYIGNTTEHFIIRNCDIHDARLNFAVYYYTESGIILHRVDNGTVTQNEVHSNDFDGIYLHSSSHVVVEENNITGNRWGVMMMDGSNNNTVQSNIINASTDYGIGLIDSLCSTVSGNIMTGNANMGVFLGNATENSVFGNNISGSIDGISLDTSDGNMFARNNLSGQSNLNMDLWHSSGNRIYHSNILGQGARDDTGANSWDSGYPTGGNHWSLYSGLDMNRDGIGDTAYAVSGGMGARDRYPFMNAWFPDSEAPVAVAGPDRSADEGTVMEFNANASTDNVGITTFTWEISSGSIAETLSGISPSYNFTSPGAHTVTLEVRDSAGNRGVDSLTVTVSDITPPTADAGADIETDVGASITFDGSGSGDNSGIASYSWSFSDGVGDIVLGSIAPSHTFTAAGVFPVILSVSDAAGLWDTDSMTVTVKADAVSPIADAGLDMTVSMGNIAIFNGSASTDNIGIENHSWSFLYNGTATELFGAVAEFTFWTAGNYTVTLTALDSAGNSGIDSITVFVQAAAEPADPGDGGENTTQATEIGMSKWVIPVIAISIVLSIAAILAIRRKRPGND